jgi:hypothetical protein
LRGGLLADVDLACRIALPPKCDLDARISETVLREIGCVFLDDAVDFKARDVRRETVKTFCFGSGLGAPAMVVDAGRFESTK